MAGPKACVVLLTLGCTLRCKMCHLWANDESAIERPTHKEWECFLSSLQGFARPGMNVIFGGGEPLLFAETLLPLIDFAGQSGFRTSLATSGYLIDAAMAHRLVTSRLHYIALTLYSMHGAVHNYLRGMPDSHEKLMQAIAYLSGEHSPLEIAIDTVIMAPNLQELVSLAEWVARDSRLRSIFFQAVMQPFHSKPQDDWRATQPYEFLWPKDTDEVDAVIDKLITLKEDGVMRGRDKINNPVSQFELFKSYFRNPLNFVKRYSCNATSGDAFTVSPDGSVNLCPYLKPIGNIRQNDIRDIWFSPEALERREEIVRCKKNCHHIVNCWYEEERGETLNKGAGSGR